MLNEMIKLYVTPLLRRLGFNKKGNIWNKHKDGIVYVFEIQSTKNLDGSKDSFTINIGIFVERLWRTLWNKDLPNFIKEEFCYPRFRLGYLLSGFSPTCRDKWWEICSEQQVTSVGEEIEVLLREKVIPFFDQTAAMADILAVSIKTNPSMPLEKLSHGILLKISGDENAALELIDGLKSDPHWGERAQEVLQRL